MIASGLESQVEELRRELEEMRAATASRPRLRLAALEASPYLGQSVALTATAAQADGAPLAGVTLTLVTSWGELYGEDDPLEGGSIAAVTGPDGTVRATLRPRVSLDDSEEQDALEAELAQLNPAAARPGDAIATLQAMAAQYRWEANRPYRNAVDSYFRDFGQKLLHDPPARDHMVSWPRIPATVIAFVEADDQAVAATVTLRFRDWLGAWLQQYSQQAEAQNSLDADFDNVKKQALGPTGILSGVLGRAVSYVDNEFGAIGKRVARGTAQKAIGKFLDTTADLGDDARGAIGPVLATGAKGLSSVLTVVGETQIATGLKVGRQEFDTGLAGKAGAAELATVRAAVNNKADSSAVDAVKASVAGKADKALFDSFQTQTGAALAAKANAADLQAGLANKADRSGFDTFQTQVSAAIASKANAADLQAVQAGMAAKADKAVFETFQTQVNTQLGRKADLSALQSLQTATNTALANKVDSTIFEGFRRQVNDRLPLVVTRAEFEALETRTNTALAAKADTASLSTMQNRLGTIERRFP
jgi:hypothetical protein